MKGCVSVRIVHDVRMRCADMITTSTGHVQNRVFARTIHPIRHIISEGIREPLKDVILWTLGR